MSYAPSRTAGFVYEDLVLPDRMERPWPGWAALTREALHSPARALSQWSVDVTRHLVGEGAPMHRGVSLAWHLVNGWLLWLVARRVLLPWGAVMAAGLWWLHPLQSESVAYVAARPDLVLAWWVLVALLCTEWRRPWWALVAAALAVTGKEQGVMALALVPLWAWWRAHSWSWALRSAWAVGGVALGGIFVARIQTSYTWIEEMSVGFTAAMLTAAGRLLLLVPEALVHPSALTIEHTWTWITWPVAVAACAAWGLLLLASGRWWPMGSLALSWSLVALLPRLLLPMPGGLHERHLYLPMVGICLAWGAVFGQRKVTVAEGL